MLVYYEALPMPRVGEQGDLKFTKAMQLFFIGNLYKLIRFFFFLSKWNGAQITFATFKCWANMNEN